MVSVYNRFQNYIIRINEAEVNIDSILRKRFDLLNKSISVIKVNTKEENVLEMISKLKSKKLTNFELDRQLYDAINEFNRSYIEGVRKNSNRQKFFKDINRGADVTESINKYCKLQIYKKAACHPD